MVGRLEAEHEERAPVVDTGGGGASPPSSSRQFVGKSPDCDSARTASAPARKSSKRTPAEALKPGAVLQPHPRLGDDAQRALAAQPQPVGRRPGAGAREAEALAGAGRRDDPHRLHEVVDVGVDGGVVAAGAGGQPAAERSTPRSSGGSGAA